MPVTSEGYDYQLPNGLSHQARTPAAVRELLDAVLAGRLGMVDPAVREPLFERDLAATQGPLACDRVLDVLVASGYANRSPQRPPAAVLLKAWFAAHRRTLKKRFNSLRPGHRNSAAYHAHRFPGVTAAELNERIARFGALLGRFGGVRAEASSAHVFRIQDPQAMRRAATSPGNNVAFSTQIEQEGVRP